MVKMNAHVLYFEYLYLKSIRFVAIPMSYIQFTPTQPTFEISHQKRENQVVILSEPKCVRKQYRLYKSVSFRYCIRI